ncbi:MAG TPA: hypothetical protein VKY24_01875 [Reyranella sp.]|nr:hypothetical protein [Reyranella sp.]
MTAIEAGGARQWGVGSVIGSAFSIFFGHFISFVGTALLVMVPSLLFRLAVPLSPFQSLVDLILGQVASVTLIYGTVQALRGRKVAIGECLSEGFKRLGVALAVAILATIGYVIGFILLVVPGIILVLMWAVAVPVAVVERAGVPASFGRSRTLTRDRRWRILGTFVVAGLIMAALEAVIGSILIASMGSSFSEAVLELASDPGAGFAVAQWVLGALMLAFYACLLATLYYYLRRDKEGVDIEQIAAVFD